MKRVLLITSSNDQYHTALEKAGYEVIPVRVGNEYDVAVGALPPSNGIDYCIVELPAVPAEAESLLERLVVRGRVIALAREYSSGVKSLLLRAGVADLLCGDRVRYCAAYLRALDGREGAPAGRILVCETEEPALRILDSIAGRYGLKVERAASVESLYEKIGNKRFECVLVNLGADGMDINKLVRNSYNRTDMRNAPIYAYKDPRKGILIHELVCGLNRITRYILDTDELYGFLTDVCIRNDMASILGDAEAFFDFNGIRHYLQGTLGMVLRQNGDDLFGNPYLEPIDLELGIEKINRLKAGLMKAEGLRWLATHFQIEKINHSERGE